MIKTDSHVDKLGTRDFVFSCHNRAFAATWSPLLPKPTETLIDQELVEYLDIPIKKIEARKFSYAGMETRIVGHISQTIQCVVNGRTNGTIHLKASVVRHLTKMINMDCIAGGQLYRRFVNTPDNVSHDISKSPQPKDRKSDDSSNNSPLSSPPSSPKATKNSAPSSHNTSLSSEGFPIISDRHNAWAYQNGSDTRYDAENDHPVDDRWSFDDEYEMWGLPYNHTGPLTKPEMKDNMVTYIMDHEDNMIAYINAVKHDWPKVGQTFPPTESPSTSQPTPTHPLNLNSAQTSTTKLKTSIESLPFAKPEPTPTEPYLNPIKQPCPGKILLHDLVFCGHHDPCPCLPGLSQQQATLLPIHCPLYLPQNHHSCGPNCGSQHVQKATPGTCHCVPPNIRQFLDPPNMLPPYSFSMQPNTRPSIQNIIIPSQTTPDMSITACADMCDLLEIGMCDFCGEDDAVCRCEDLYFHLKTEQENYAEM